MRCLNLVTISAITILILIGGACARKGSADRDTNQNQNNQQETFADAQSAATQSLTIFRRLVNNQNYRDLGFESPDEVANATLGEPLPVMFVRLDQLRGYQAGTDVNSLLGQSNEVNFPVIANNQVRSSVVVEQVNGRWKTGTLGNGALAKHIAAVRRDRTGAALVHFAALGLYFLGERNTDNKWTLTPLVSNSELNLAAGRPIPAEEVFTRLAGAAKTLRDDAPM
jgi:hypothetical protein